MRLDLVAVLSPSAKLLCISFSQNFNVPAVQLMPAVRKGRYLVAEGEATIYVAFMGTKSAWDLLTNAAILQQQLWPEHRFGKQVTYHDNQPTDPLHL